MGNIVRKGEETTYRQENGDVTAWLTDFEEKTALVHEGTPAYKHIFHLLVTVGAIYLIVIFTLY